MIGEEPGKSVMGDATSWLVTYGHAVKFARLNIFSMYQKKLSSVQVITRARIIGSFSE